MVSIDLSLNGLLHGNFFNFLIVLFLIIFAFSKLDILNLLDSAKDKILDALKNSDKEKALSEDVLDSAKNDIKNLPQELEQIKVDAVATIEAFKSAANLEIEKMQERLEKNARSIITNELQRVDSELQKELALNAVKDAYAKTVGSLAQDIQLHRKFISDAIDKLEGIEIK